MNFNPKMEISLDSEIKELWRDTLLVLHQIAKALKPEPATHTGQWARCWDCGVLLRPAHDHICNDSWEAAQ